MTSTPGFNYRVEHHERHGFDRNPSSNHKSLDSQETEDALAAAYARTYNVQGSIKNHNQIDSNHLILFKNKTDKPQHFSYKHSLSCGEYHAEYVRNISLRPFEFFETDDRAYGDVYKEKPVTLPIKANTSVSGKAKASGSAEAAITIS